MTITFSTEISELNERGFIHIPSFLDPGEIKLFCQDFQTAKAVDTDNYSMKHVSSEVFEKISKKLETIVHQIQETGMTKVNEFDGPGMYFPNWKEEATLVNPEPSVQKFPWHQDHESYFLLQDHSDYFNFYIPIIKPVPEKSNLTLIPIDKLKERVPELSERLSGRGATRIVKDGNQDVILDDDLGGILARLDFNVTELEETPQLQAGDLLLVKGDVLHKTQDASTQRVAVSFRLLNSHSMIQRKKLAKGGLVKTIIMLNSWKKYELEFRYFDSIQSDIGTFDEMLKYIESKTLPINFRKSNFIIRLLSERLREGSLFRMLLDLRLLNLLLQQ